MRASPSLYSATAVAATAVAAAVLAAAALSVAACASADTKSPPDDESSATAGSTISNQYTTIVGELPLDTAISDSIDYPEYYLGRTIELRAGQALEMTITSSRKSLVRVYGPATSVVDGQPQFGTALVNTETKLTAGKQRAAIEVTAPAAGTYMLVYGPTNVWKASYVLRATCVAGCEAVAAEGDECGGFPPPGVTPLACAPGLACVGPYGVIPDITGRCGTLTTVAALLSNPDAFEGHYVGISGVVETAIPTCTKIACPTSNMCCNTCSAEQRLFDTDVQPAVLAGVTLIEGDAPHTCSGDSCTYQNHCTITDGGQWVSGWFNGPDTSLAIDRRYATP